MDFGKGTFGPRSGRQFYADEDFAPALVADHPLVSDDSSID